MDIEKKIEELELQISELKEGTQDKLSIVVFSGDLDKLLAAMIIATGATAYDMEVDLFFTFWGLSALRDAKKKVKGKDFMSKMFGIMLPKGSKKVKLSKMNMAGMGTAMLKSLMKKKNVASLDEMFKTAGELGVRINVCEMSMGLMGIEREEIIDYPHLNYVGVGSYLSDAQESNIQLFI